MATRVCDSYRRSSTAQIHSHASHGLPVAVYNVTAELTRGRRRSKERNLPHAAPVRCYAKNSLHVLNHHVEHSNPRQASAVRIPFRAAVFGDVNAYVRAREQTQRLLRVNYEPADWNVRQASES